MKKSNNVCWHFRNGHCRLGEKCRFLHSLENAGAAEELEPPPPSRKEVSDRVLPVDRSCVSSAQVHKPQFRPSGGGMQAQTTAMLDHRGQEESLPMSPDPVDSEVDSLLQRMDAFYRTTLKFPLPEFLRCPISREPFSTPVLVKESGVTYEKKYIQKWIELSANPKDPVTGHSISLQSLVDNRLARELIQALRVGSLFLYPDEEWRELLEGSRLETPFWKGLHPLLDTPVPSLTGPVFLQALMERASHQLHLCSQQLLGIDPDLWIQDLQGRMQFLLGYLSPACEAFLDLILLQETQSREVHSTKTGTSTTGTTSSSPSSPEQSSSSEAASQAITEAPLAKQLLDLSLSLLEMLDIALQTRGVLSLEDLPGHVAHLMGSLGDKDLITFQFVFSADPWMSEIRATPPRDPLLSNIFFAPGLGRPALRLLLGERGEELQFGESWQERSSIFIGVFSSVFRGALIIAGMEQDVAVKVFHDQGNNESFLDELRALMYSRFAVTREREEDTLQRRPLPHVVQFFGFQVVPMPALVTTLCQFSLVESQNTFPNLLYRLGILTRVATVLASLHRTHFPSKVASTSQMHFVHGNLKPGKILLDEEENVFVADTGLSVHPHLKAMENISTTPPIAWAEDKLKQFRCLWVAPEVLRGEDPTPASDVFSLGLVILNQVMSSRTPHPSYECISGQHTVWAAMKHYSEGQKFPSLQEIPMFPVLGPGGEAVPIPMDLVRLIDDCCHPLPGCRPCAEDVEVRLQSLSKMVKEQQSSDEWHGGVVTSEAIHREFTPHCLRLGEIMVHPLTFDPKNLPDMRSQSAQMIMWRCFSEEQFSWQEFGPGLEKEGAINQATYVEDGRKCTPLMLLCSMRRLPPMAVVDSLFVLGANVNLGFPLDCLVDRYCDPATSEEEHVSLAGLANLLLSQSGVEVERTPGLSVFRAAKHPNPTLFCVFAEHLGSSINHLECVELGHIQPVSQE